MTVSPRDKIAPLPAEKAGTVAHLELEFLYCEIGPAVSGRRLPSAQGRAVPRGKGYPAYSRPGKPPPSSRMFCPVMKPACWEQRNATTAPNSAGVPKRPAGTAAVRSASTVASGTSRVSAASD